MPTVRKLADDEVQELENKGKASARSSKSSTIVSWPITPSASTARPISSRARSE